MPSIEIKTEMKMSHVSKRYIIEHIVRGEMELKCSHKMQQKGQ